MAGPTGVTPAVVAKPLSEFAVIGHNTYLYTSPSYNPPQTPLILIFAWNAAAAKHIAKYTVAYTRLFPSARIVLVRCWTIDMFRWDVTYRKFLTPAMDVVKEHINAGGEILVHSFSNGGGNQVVEFARAWQRREGTTVPMRVQVLDSAPTKGAWKRSHAAMTTSLPRTWFFRLFGSAMIHLLLCMIFIFERGTGKDGRMVVLCRELNDKALFDTRVPRLYLYSLADTMVGHEEVEDHIVEGTANGYNIEKVRFENSAHAGHVREDEGKYWGAIMDIWKRNGSS